MRQDDGDEEDLEEHEVLEALQTCARNHTHAQPHARTTMRIRDNIHTQPHATTRTRKHTHTK
eukprot:4886419-Pleurochrysis_carterae.AAC.1